jgi:NADPH-dependent curcumin reductase CurA
MQACCARRALGVSGKPVEESTIVNHSPALLNRQWRLQRYVAANEVVSREHFTLVECPVPALRDGELLVRVLVLGTSPAQRMYVSEDREFHLTVDIGEPMSCRGIGEVVESRHPKFAAGDIVQASLGWQEYAIVTPDASNTDQNVRKVSRLEHPERPLHASLSLFGQLGFSAYVGIVETAQVRSGDVVVISSAAGGVGSIACQLARIRGAATVIGIAGGPEKCAWLTDNGLCDIALDYHADGFVAALDEACGGGVDVYLDSVGGDILDAVLQHLAVGARVVLCGHIATEYQRPRPPGPRNYFNLIYRRARMEGFFVFDHIAKWPAYERQLRSWYGEGLLTLLDHVFEGVESAPDALNSLFTGGNIGGCVIRVAEDPQGLPLVPQDTFSSS